MAEQPKIPNLSGLTELADRGSGDIKPTLLRVMTDLYIQKPVHTVEEENHFTVLAKRLIDQVDDVARTELAAKLADYPAAPRAVLDHLALKLAGPDREATSPAPPQPQGAATLGELSELFLTSDSEARRMILLHLEYADLPAAEPVPPHMLDDVISRLEIAALNHNPEAFAQEVERAFGIERGMARRLIDDECGEPLVALAQALSMRSDVLQRILLCLNPAISHSVLRVYELSKLYEELDRDSAERLIAIWQATHPAQRTSAQRVAPQRAPHQPQHYDDGKERPSLPARPAIRWEEHAQRRVGES